MIVVVEGCGQVGRGSRGGQRKALTPRRAARRVGRDVKAVHSDVTALLLAGVLDRTASGQVEFPYDAVKVEFLLEAA